VPAVIRPTPTTTTTPTTTPTTTLTTTAPRTPADDGPADDGPADDGRTEDSRTDDDGSGLDGPNGDGPNGDGPNGNGPHPGGSSGGSGLLPTGIEMRVALTTLLGLDDRPAEIPGLGPVLADVARRVAARQLRGAEWRFAVCDPDGYLLLGGVTRNRPTTIPGTSAGPAGGRSRGGIVELQVTAAQLDQLAAKAADPAAEHLPPGWAGLVADLAAQYADRHRLSAALNGRPDDRFPHAALARHIQIRDRACTHPCCTRPARRCELDHTIDHAAGGKTLDDNIGPGCKRHHRYKHQLNWRLTQPQPGIFVWTSPLGQVYRTRGDPILPPLPDPLPGPPEPANDDDISDPYVWWKGPILRDLTPKPKPEPRPPPQPPEPDDDEPPF
jgi:hypothetical protein